MDSTNGHALAILLRQFLASEGQPTTGTSKDVDRIIEAFGIALSPTSELDPGQGLTIVHREDTLVGVFDRISLYTNASSKARNSSVIAHELGHVFYIVQHSICETIAPSANVERGDASDLERFCWDFSLEICCSSSVTNLWTSDYFNELIKTSRSRPTPEDEHWDDVQPLNFSVLKDLAKRCHISVRLLLRALDRHPITSELQVGIAVLKNSANYYTNRDLAIRIWQSVRPAWGHIIFNETAEKHGFLHAKNIYEHASPLRPEVHLENLLLINKHRGVSGKRWHKEVIQSTCYYIAIDVFHEGRYLIAIWRWPIPVDPWT